MLFRSVLLLLFTSTTCAWVPNNHPMKQMKVLMMNAESHFLPADVISRTGEPVSGITYSNYASQPVTGTNHSQQPSSSSSSTSSYNSDSQTTEPKESPKGELIEATASLIREDTIISPPVPVTTGIVQPKFVSRGHPVDEVGVRFWRDTIGPPATYHSSIPPSSTVVKPESVVTTTADQSSTVTPEKAAFQQAEMDRWNEAARRDEQRRMEQQAEKEAFKEGEMARWTEAAKRDTHRKNKKQAAKKTGKNAPSQSRKKKGSSDRKSNKK